MRWGRGAMFTARWDALRVRTQLGWGRGLRRPFGGHALMIEQPAPVQPWLEALTSCFREMANGPQIDHRNPVNGCERTSTNATKNIDFI